jgi:hypothetical protein
MMKTVTLIFFQIINIQLLSARLHPTELERACNALSTPHIYTHYTCVTFFVDYDNHAPSGRGGRVPRHETFPTFIAELKCNELAALGVTGHLLWIDSWSLWMAVAEYFISIMPTYIWIGMRRLNFTTADDPGR